jgi:hypothetical protein
MTGSNTIATILTERPKANSSPALRRLLDRLAVEWNSQLGYRLTWLSAHLIGAPSLSKS